jgi:hypothetical protein
VQKILEQIIECGVSEIFATDRGIHELFDADTLHQRSDRLQLLVTVVDGDHPLRQGISPPA